MSIDAMDLSEELNFLLRFPGSDEQLAELREVLQATHQANEAEREEKLRYLLDVGAVGGLGITTTIVAFAWAGASMLAKARKLGMSGGELVNAATLLKGNARA